MNPRIPLHETTAVVIVVLALALLCWNALLRRELRRRRDAASRQAARELEVQAAAEGRKRFIAS